MPGRGGGGPVSHWAAGGRQAGGRQSDVVRLSPPSLLALHHINTQRNPNPNPNPIPEPTPATALLSTQSPAHPPLPHSTALPQHSAARPPACPPACPLVMALTLAIPTTTLSAPPGKPHTLYHITLALPLRTLTVSRRYSEFLVLHSQLVSITGMPPPLPPPPKAYFTRTISNPTLTENRRLALESYMHAILLSADPRWRDSPPWRTFLNLPAHSSGSNSAASSITNLAWGGGGGVGAPGPITDPAQWLDSHRHAKTLLHDARMQLAKRDQAVSAADQHEASAGAKRCLIKASTVIAALDAGLKTRNKEDSTSSLLDGEIRRRRDLLSAARKERDGLESLANSLAAKRNASTSATAAAAPSGERTALFAGKPRGRVLGAPLPETERTRELDNVGVLQLNDEFMREQDKVVAGLLGNVTRMREIGTAIGEEIDVQNRMLGALDADVEKYALYLCRGERNWLTVCVVSTRRCALRRSGSTRSRNGRTDGRAVYDLI